MRTSLHNWIRRSADRLWPDRETTLTSAKAVVAATIAWLLATYVFGASHATFAAFSALMLVELTIVDSIAKAVRYIAAMVVGIGLVGAAVWLWGVAVWVFPVVVFVALIIGRWHRLGSQGINVAVAVIFAYGAFGAPSANRPNGPLPEIAAMVLLGATVALVVTLLIAPPLRYRSARYAVESLAGSLAELLSDIAEGLTGDGPNADVDRDWRRRADAMPNLAAQTRDTVDHAIRTTRFNPRRLLARDHTSVVGHRVTVHALERIADQLRSVVIGLVRAVERSEVSPRHDEFLRRYGVLLAAVRDAVTATGGIHTAAEFGADTLADEARRCRAAFDDLTVHVQGRGLDRPTQWAVYGALYTDAERLCEEVESARDAYRAPGAAVTTLGASA